MRRTLMCSVVVLLFTLTATANPIQDENAKPGSTGWHLVNGRSTEIEGYASLTSVNLGQSIDFYVSTTQSTFDIEVYRTGYYQGKGGRLMTTVSGITGQKQTIPTPDPATGFFECNWTKSYTLAIPDSWVSGVYVVKMTAQPGGQQNWMMFVVRDDARRSDLLFQSSVATMNAYNGWGGKSLYGFNSTGPQAQMVSFNRPYGAGAGFTEYGRWEFPTVRFLEKEGYDVTYSTDIDTHNNGDLLLNHHGWLSVGHNEYWTYQMRQNVIRARDSGVGLGFFSANTSYWQIRLAPDSKGAPNRTMIAYKETALISDPLAHDGDPTNDYLITTAFRNPPVNMPEEAFKGNMWVPNSHETAVKGDIMVENTSHWVFANTGLHDGDHLAGLLGYEVDGMFTNYPPNTVRLAHSPFTDEGITKYSDMTVYLAASGATVFSTGSMDWAYGLDDTGVQENPPPPGGYLNAAAQQITRNVLARFIAGPQPQPGPKRRIARHG